jgi:hypothetical protein
MVFTPSFFKSFFAKWGRNSSPQRHQDTKKGPADENITAIQY